MDTQHVHAAWVSSMDIQDGHEACTCSESSALTQYGHVAWRHGHAACTGTCTRTWTCKRTWTFIQHGHGHAAWT
jgi:hypothetical protein